MRLWRLVSHEKSMLMLRIHVSSSMKEVAKVGEGIRESLDYNVEAAYLCKLLHERTGQSGRSHSRITIM